MKGQQSIEQDWCLVCTVGAGMIAFTGCYHWACLVLDFASAVPCADHAWRCSQGTDGDQ